jgi:hypothetical protein
MPNSDMVTGFRSAPSPSSAGLTAAMAAANTRTRSRSISVSIFFCLPGSLPSSLS